MVTAGKNGYTITRNSSFFKKIDQDIPDPLMDLGLDDSEVSRQAEQTTSNISA